MKLKNKKTGDIVRVEFLSNWQTDDGTEIGFRECNTNVVYSYNSLAELNSEWEDYEEPKEYWYIEPDGSIIQNHKPTYINHLLDGLKSIGNYFETKEEAEQAMEKLKAWKRLKDKGFRFERWLIGGEYGNTITFSEYIEYDDETRADLDLLFGGKE